MRRWSRHCARFAPGSVPTPPGCCWSTMARATAMLLARLAGLSRPAAAAMVAAFAEPLLWGDAARQLAGSICQARPMSKRRGAGGDLPEHYRDGSSHWEAAMASRPTEPVPISGRVDREGRLIAADPSLERLQVDAGSALGRPLALPQMAALARAAASLGVPLSRALIAADSSHDLDLFVRAEPQGDEVELTIERWAARPGRRAAPRAGRSLCRRGGRSGRRGDVRIRNGRSAQPGGDIAGAGAAAWPRCRRIASASR